MSSLARTMLTKDYVLQQRSVLEGLAHLQMPTHDEETHVNTQHSSRHPKRTTVTGQPQRDLTHGNLIVLCVHKSDVREKRVQHSLHLCCSRLK